MAVELQTTEKEAETFEMPDGKPAKVKRAVKKTAAAGASAGGKHGNATLIITEKPQAAEKIAMALSAGEARKYSENGVSYFEFDRGGKRIIVGCAVGHLFGLAQKERGASVPNFDIDWKPLYENKGAAYTKKYYALLGKLAKQSSEFIVASDYDIEGEVIGWNVVRFIAGQKDAKRMKFSSLTTDELNESYENVSPTLNWGQAIAGETRHYLDWFYGINLSRALMKSLQGTGRFRVLSIGRVQGPALGVIVDKELQIRDFKSTPYWQVFLTVQDLNKQKAELKYNKDITNETELLRFRQLKGKKAVATTEIKDEKIDAPLPWDLTTLQTESYRLCGLTPSQTLQVAQKLYLEGLISYPRTSSQKYPESIGYDKILKKLAKHFSAVKYATEKKPTEGKKSDPAHPAIYPTGEHKKLEGAEKNLYEMIVSRFIACFCKPALIEDKKISVNINDMIFAAKGLQIKEKNWMQVYDANLKETKLGTMNGNVDVKELRIEEKMTQPPKRYTEASMVRELEKKNLGTKATRANIIETLYSRGYIKERSIEATPLGIKLVETLKKYSPIILDEELTREIEKETEGILEAKKDFLPKEEKILARAKEVIIKITADMIKHQKQIGNAIAEGNSELREEEIKENTLNVCPACKKGSLRILFNRAARRYFVACNGYPDCKTTFSLPPNSLIKPAKKECKLCKWPMLLAIRKAKRPWEFCFNPNCESRKIYEAQKAERMERVLAGKEKPGPVELGEGEETANNAEDKTKK